MADNLITFKEPKSPISESYRMVRTNLHYLNIDNKNKAIVVTSSNPGEGKTTTMANLAITMSQAGQKVLLVECDLRKPRVHKTFDLDNNMGLVNVIVENKSVRDVIHKIDSIPNLNIITAGPIPPDPAELLQSTMMKELIDKFKNEYDVVLFDAPPVCSVTDAAILSNLVDGVILVVASGETNIESAKLAKKLLQKVHANILGVVLSKADISKTGGYYYHYYEYGEDATTKKHKKRKHKRK
ncbi:capsular polysaccharide biosynthesis protein [Vallitalea longa]|uniref:non-specific protein-tyrosine kinase n=1 Tax=Vallitalea longa TaxID=2936439 RepID=A0A9W6DIC9_9FIRM|nr:CpsD/CapB family tyrosine-protein kinase [Vallitalea longa]GKX31774.1 capsular polysaccharide biosynthesis protein [Vallitalea longa]